MCAHFESIRDPERFKAFFKLELPEKALFDVWPSYESTFIRLKTANTQERDISNN